MTIFESLRDPAAVAALGFGVTVAWLLNIPHPAVLVLGMILSIIFALGSLGQAPFHLFSSGNVIVSVVLIGCFMGSVFLGTIADDLLEDHPVARVVFWTPFLLAWVGTVA